MSQTIKGCATRNAGFSGRVAICLGRRCSIPHGSAPQRRWNAKAAARLRHVVASLSTISSPTAAMVLASCDCLRVMRDEDKANILLDVIVNARLFNVALWRHKKPSRYVPVAT